MSLRAYRYATRQLLYVVPVAALAIAAGCGDATGEVGSTNPEDAATGAQDTGGAVDDDAGSVSTDTGAVSPDTGAASEDTGSASTDTGPVDTKNPAACPGGVGCACAGNDECDNGLCVESGTSKICAAPCVDSCAPGFACASVNTGGGDTATFCVPQYDRLCAPCTKSDHCKTLGFDGNACMDRGADGGFCGVTCSDDSGCPTDYACVSGKTVEGATTKQCLPKDGADGAATACGCTEWASATKASTTCKIEAKNDKGEIVSSCPGTRSCDAAGLTKCVGDSPEGETCNGKDDDCDGKTDEETCNDNNPCTVDGCDPAADGGKGACVHNKIDGPCDADGSVCTESDKCISGVCTPGPAKVCNDGNGCTKDACDIATGCTATDDDGLVCDDDNPCTVGDVCQKGSCEAGNPKVCAANDACVDAKCSLKTGKCAYDDKPAGSPCDDGSKCTSGDACKTGKCVGAAKNCDDGNACTDDACKADSGCAYTHNAGPCEDGTKCTNGDICKGGKCKAGQSKNCDDGNPCTQRSCNPDDGQCQTKKLAIACDDGSKCTAKDACDDGFCTGKAVDCDDGQVCTTDSCDKLTGCANANNKLPCDDQDKCTESDTCGGGKCAGLPIALTACDDNDPCTTDSCAADKGCVNAPATNVPCDDGNKCTKGDVCQQGKCSSGTNVCQCVKDEDCAKSEDGNLCNGTLYCDVSGALNNCKINPKTVVTCPDGGQKCQQNVCNEKTGKCGLVNVADGTGCDADGSVCTQKDACSAGACKAGTTLPCDDGKVCTDDSCDPKSGCVFVINASACDADGSVCTEKDSCKNGLCIAGPKKDCNDSNDCTDDSCDAKKGCVNAANTAKCDDGNPCTTSDVCAASKCAGKGLSCDDNNACTKDSCSLKSGCANDPLQGSCEDGDACTVGDACAASKDGKWGCSPGKPRVCDDNNVCTTDGCDPKTGCTKTADTKTVHVCYSGADGTAGKGTCVKGKATCKADATMGPCAGEVVPNNVELCDGKDDTCDGKTDEGCKAERATVGFGSVTARVSGGKYTVKAWASDGATGSSTGSKQTNRWGVLSWLKALLGN